GPAVEQVPAHRVGVDVDGELESISATARHYDTPDFLASRGEYLNGRILAQVLGATFVDPANSILFDEEGRLHADTYARLAQALAGEGRYVIPGFYGADAEGRIKTFSRGGSDVTGAVVARASMSKVYENWTDVSGFMMTDPRIVPDAKRIDKITYSELRELAYMGASVLHDEAIFPVRDVNIPINIRNTWEPDNPGTLIVGKRRSTQPVRGIAARKGFCMINIEKAFMNKELGFGRRVLEVLEKYRINFEHMPTGIDAISLIVRDEELGKHGPAIVRDIKRQVEPDSVKIERGLALIATVGQGMHHHIGVAARLCTALAEARVNLHVIDQGASETNIIFGVGEADLERAVHALYRAVQVWEPVRAAN
ncbi:MAG: aspartate kinase, partial [Candidatus Hydrogenedentales bacterium]